MVREYIRPELLGSDLDLLLAGRVVAINPDVSDIADAIKAVEKGCRKNKLDLLQANAAWTQVNQQNSVVACAGHWVNSSSHRYDTQGTVIVFVRISDELTGMSCGRQSILPGKCSTIPLSGFSIEENPLQWFNALAELFWTHLSESEVAELKQQAALKVLAASNGSPDEWQPQWQQLRTSHLRVLQNLQDPVNVTELQAAGKRVAAGLTACGVSSITWRALKQQEPSFTSRYQRQLLEIVDGGVLRSLDLENLSDKSAFSIRFSVWRGEERIFNVPQLVLEVEARDLLTTLRRGNKAQRTLANLIKGSADWKWHPGQSNCVGWFRVHIDDQNKLCFIDEVQSDTVEEVTAYLRDKRQLLSAKEISCIEEYLRAVKHWHVHGYACLSQWAAEIDYQLAIHSRESAAMVKTGMTPSDRKWNTYYGFLIKRYNMAMATVEGYPAPVCVAANLSSQLLKNVS